MTRILAAALILLTTPALADRITAEAECAPGREDLHYTCTFTLRQGEEPVSGAAFTVKPSMPSMPMAHNIPPVSAQRLEEPGTYGAMLHLDMHGAWALELEVSEPARDRIVVHHDFHSPE